jgi:hypothetical protein
MTRTDQSKRRNTYTGYETSFTGRLPNGGHIFGSWTIDRTTHITCDAPIGTNYYGYPLVDGNNVTNASLNDPNSLRFCDERGLIPFRSEVKVIAAIPIKWGLEGSLVYQSSPEILKYVNWDITKGTVYPVDCKGCTPGALVNPNLTNTTERITLAVPGSRFSDRLNQLDLGIKRTFVFREKYRVQAQVDVFNVNNAHTVLVEGQNLGTTPGSSIAPFVLGGPGGKPTSILQARLLRLAMQFHF